MRIENDILEVLSRAEVDGNALKLVGQLERKLYIRTNKAIEAAGGKWNRKAAGHLFDGDASDRVDQMILTGEVAVPKDEFNYFPSPPAVVERIMEEARIKPGMLVLEPSAGRGAIARAAAKAGAIVDCYELMDENAYELLKDGFSVSFSDFLGSRPNPRYDRVVMNPPFAKQADIKHVRHAYEFLKPGGRLVAVMSAGVGFRNDLRARDFRSFVELSGGTIEPLPEGSFKESGTLVSTVLVTIDA